MRLTEIVHDHSTPKSTAPGLLTVRTNGVSKAMIAATSKTAGRDLFKTPAGLPAKGSRIHVCGFPREQHAEAARLVELCGYLPTAFAAGADAVLVPELNPAIVEEANRAGRPVLVPDLLRGDVPPPCHRSAVEIDDDSVRILDVTLPRRAAGARLVPPASRFAHLCLDASFLQAARIVAVAAESRLPCGLEGDTAVAKTTAVLWVAHICRQEAVRLNLNGQSDTGELVGRFVPAAERQAAAPWRFREGLIPEAMRQGHWVVLDELNLAEPQVLERLNPVLEQPPTLVLSENGGEQFGAHGDVPIHDAFRVFATMNPAEYSGRSVLSPAFRDRFALWNILATPSEAELRALLARLVHGVQPEFVLDGVIWKAADADPVYPHLAGQRGIDAELDAIAAFHSAVAMAGAEIGRTRRERYIFTRRTLLAAMSLLAARVAQGEELRAASRRAIDLIYRQRVTPGPDRQALETILRTAELA